MTPATARHFVRGAVTLDIELHQSLVDTERVRGVTAIAAAAGASGVHFLVLGGGCRRGVGVVEVGGLVTGQTQPLDVGVVGDGVVIVGVC